MVKTEQLVDTITRAIQEKKGEDIAIIDLRKTDGAIASYFIICQGNSPIQVNAIAESIGDMARIELSEKPAHVNGLDTCQWVAIDYVDVIVHIFMPECVIIIIWKTCGRMHLQRWCLTSTNTGF